MSMIIEITRKIRIGEILQTPSGRSQFKIYHINADRVMIQTKKGTILTIPASCFESVPNFLRGKDWVKIGAKHGIANEETLDGFLQRFTHGTSIASYVAPILERTSIIEIDRKLPAKIRLKIYKKNGVSPST